MSELVLHKDVHLGRNKSPVLAKLALSDIVNVKALLPQIPGRPFGHADLVSGQSLGMYGNDRFGDCVAAGAAHEHRISSVISGTPALFSDQDVLKAYAAMNGHRYPIKAGGVNDQGTDMVTAASWRRKTGITDQTGKVHKIDAYVSIEAGNIEDMLVALYIFDQIGCGINFPGSAMDQFNAGKPWDVVKGASIEGGHYFPIVAGINDTESDGITWGAYQPFTDKFYEKYNDETLAYINLENLNKKTKQTLEHIDLPHLNTYIAELPKAA